MLRSSFALSQLFAVVFLAVLASLIHGIDAAATATSKAAKIEGAKAYVAAVISHSDKDINRIPLADNVTRFEAIGRLPYSQTANGSKSLRDSLKFGNTAFFVTGSAEPDKGLGNYTVLRNGTVSSVYRLRAGLLGLGFVTTRVTERFDFTKDGKIYNITAEASV
ncbi:hypothetical protein V8E36_000826 [Tilletia maclaganii]